MLNESDKTDLNILALWFYDSLSFKLRTWNSSKSDITPNVVISKVNILTDVSLSFTMRWLYRLWYLDCLYLWDDDILVSCKQSVLVCRFASCTWLLYLSGRDGKNKSLMGFTEASSMSAYSSHLSFRCDLNQSINIPRTWSCLLVYLDKLAGEPHFDKTCLFVCTSPHNGQEGDVVFSHLNKLEAVGSCCCSAFLANLNKWSETVSSNNIIILILIIIKIIIILLIIMMMNF